MKTKIVRDVPIGVLLIVLSMWCLALVQYLAGWPNFIHLIGIVVLSGLVWRFVNVGLDVIVGIEIADKNGKE